MWIWECGIRVQRFSVRGSEFKVKNWVPSVTSEPGTLNFEPLALQSDNPERGTVNLCDLFVFWNIKLSIKFGFRPLVQR